MSGNLHYEFHGMDPSDWTESFLNDEFHQLMESAPPEANMKLRVEKHYDGLEGKLMMTSKAGTFVVEHKNGDITSLVKSLKKKMKGKLLKWKDSGHHLYTANGKAG